MKNLFINRKGRTFIANPKIRARKSCFSMLRSTVYIRPCRPKRDAKSVYTAVIGNQTNLTSHTRSHTQKE
jgi:hypothetical protein